MNKLGYNSLKPYQGISMKILIGFFVLMISAQSFASDVVPCKSEAQLAIYERYMYESPDAVVSLRTKYKPYLSGDEAIHIVQVIDMESGQSTIMSAIMDAKTCKVKAVN